RAVAMPHVRRTGRPRGEHRVCVPGDRGVDADRRARHEGRPVDMITVDPGSAVAPFDQIRTQLADGIRSGELAAGSRLPSIRQLAADLRVAAGTVAKAYTALEGEGLLVSSRALGTRVAPGQAHAPALREAAEHYVRQARGLTLEEALGAVRAAWHE